MFNKDWEAIGERLIKLRKALNIKSSRQLALSIEADPSYFAKAEKGGGISESYVERLYMKYKVNDKWLYFGEGEMIIKGDYITERFEKKNLKKTRSSLLDNPGEGIPIYDVPIDASFLERFRDESHYEPIGFLNIPKLRNCNFAAIISGNSMWPLMKSGTIAACRIVEQLDYFDEGEMYFVSTSNGFETVKYVQSGDKPDELKLIPHNEKIKPSIIKKDMIIKMCIVEAWLNFR